MLLKSQILCTSRDKSHIFSRILTCERMYPSFSLRPEQFSISKFLDHRDLTVLYRNQIIIIPIKHIGCPTNDKTGIVRFSPLRHSDVAFRHSYVRFFDLNNFRFLLRRRFGFLRGRTLCIFLPESFDHLLPFLFCAYFCMIFAAFPNASE